MITVEHKYLGDMQVTDIVGEYKTAALTHFDGNTRTVYYTDIETPFPEGEKISSCTDVEGYITLVNTTFVRMSGYSKEELIGTPHYILHHPDMPRLAFEGLWDSLATKGRWQGFVKNLRKDGGYYWVDASIFSNYRQGNLVGYTSVRTPVSREQIAICERQYRDLLAQENA